MQTCFFKQVMAVIKCSIKERLMEIERHKKVDVSESCAYFHTVARKSFSGLTRLGGEKKGLQD